MRQPTWYHYVGVLALAGVGYLIMLATSSHDARPVDTRPPDRPPPPVRVDNSPWPDSTPSPWADPPQFPLPETGGEPHLVTTPQEWAILRGLNPEHDDVHFSRFKPDQLRAYQERVEQRKRAFEEAGGNTPAALPLYLKVLTAESRLWRKLDARVMRKVAEIPGDRSAFRRPAVARLNDPDLNLAKAAMQLLVQIGTAEDVPAVVERFVKIEYDDRIEPRDHAYFAEGLKILAKFGGEAEIAALDKAKAEHLLHNDDKFWAKAEACKAAIRERLAKEKR